MLERNVWRVCFQYLNEKFIRSENKAREETWTSLRKNRYRLRLRRSSRCRFWKRSRRDDTTCSPGGSGCNKSPNQVDIWRMERWNWFLAASKSCVCQGGKRVPEKRTWGKWTTRDRFPTGFMPLFFIRRRRVPRHSTRRDTIFHRVPFLGRRAHFISLYLSRARSRTLRAILTR